MPYYSEESPLPGAIHLFGKSQKDFRSLEIDQTELEDEDISGVVRIFAFGFQTAGDGGRITRGGSCRVAHAAPQWLCQHRRLEVFVGHEESLRQLSPGGGMRDAQLFKIILEGRGGGHGLKQRFRELLLQ